MSIRKRGKDTYEITIDLGTDPVTGKRKRYYETVKGKKNAERRERELRRELDLGTFVVPTDITLAEFLEDWLREKAKQVKPSTVSSYQQILNLYVVPYLGKIKMKDLKPQHFVRLYEHLQSDEMDISNRTVKYVHTVLKAALNKAVQWELLPKNIIENVDPPRQTKVKFNVWDEQEIKRFLEAAKDSWYYEVYYLALTTGMRQGELLGLKWRNVDLEKKRIYVVEQYNLKTKTFEEVKTDGSRRNISIDNDTALVLQRLKKKQAAMRLKAEYWQDNNLVFCTRNGLPIQQRNLVRNFKEYIKRAGVPDIRFHDLRHTHATYCLTKGWHPKVVQERLGHSSIQVTLDTYSHVIPNLQEELAMATFGGFLGGANKNDGKMSAK